MAMQQCATCGKQMVRGLNMHMKTHEARTEPAKAAAAVADRPPQEMPFVVSEPPEAWLRRKGAPRKLTALEQIRRSPTQHEGAGAYFLNPDGATIREALIYYPNGATSAEVGKYGENYEYYHKRQADKGLHFLGATLGPDAVRRLVETLVKNRPDEIQVCQYEIVMCNATLQNSGVQREREVAARRREQFKRRLEYLMEPLDADGLIAELQEIGEAQTIAKLDPATRKAMELLLSQQRASLLGIVAKLSKAPEGRATSKAHTIAEANGPDEFMGVSYLEVGPDDA